MLLNRIILFNQKINANGILFIIDLILILYFAKSWYRTYKRTGWKIDYWQITIFKMLILPILIMYPFNASINNIEVVGKENYDNIVSKVDLAFSISLLGYLFVYVGSYFYNKTNLYLYIDRLFSPINLLIENNIKNNQSLYVAAFLSISLILFVTYIQIANNVLFNPRFYFMTHGSVRPFYNITLLIYPFTLTYFGLRIIQSPNWSSIAIFLFLLGVSIFLGTRGAILEPVLTIILFYYFKKYKVLKLKKIMMYGFVIVFAAFIIQNLRNKISVSENMFARFFQDFFYGNSFSDNRDFAWILAYWDEKYLLGKTYISGLISFIPRQYSDFRNEWNFGIFTTRTAHLDSNLHPGLRPGIFGEAFLNFSYLGVIMLGFIVGVFVRHIDASIKYYINYNQDVIKAFSQGFPLIIVFCLCLSVNFMSLYSYLIITFTLAAFRQALQVKRVAINDK